MPAYCIKMIPLVEFPLAIPTCITVSSLIIIAIRQWVIDRKNRTLPPGPMPLPLLGNILSINSNEPWLTYTEWGATYGDLIFVRILDQEMVVINSQHVAEALLDKRSRIYSDRPYLATVKPFGWSFNFAFASYNDEWRIFRRIFHQTFRPESAVKFRPMQVKFARQMVVNMIDDPQHCHFHFATFTSSTAMSAVYGYEPKSRDDHLVRLVGDGLDLGVRNLTPERALMLKTFPFLLKLPDWCWGSSLKRDARASTDQMTKVVNLPFEHALQHMADDPESSLGKCSMVAEHLQRMEKQDEASKVTFQTTLKNSAITAIGGAYETTTATLMTFVLAMVLHPDVQARAQAEIDSVIGRDRLPTFEDRESLPYVDAVVRENYRWTPIGPLGLPHNTTSEDMYNGYTIPKGAIVMVNIWAIARDEKRYPDAGNFVPERFIDVNGSLTDDDPKEYIFGRGRRICPGRYAADASIWCAIATMLATLNISSAKDDQGNVVDFTPKFRTGVVCYPTMFPCSISARSHVDTELLESL